MININQNFIYRAICCFCSKKFNLGDLEDHMKSCKNQYETKLEEQILLVSDYEKLFLKIRENECDFSGQNKDKYFEDFNLKALKLYQDYMDYSLLKVNPEYMEKLSKIPKEITINTDNNINIIAVLKVSSQIFSNYNKLKSSEKNLKDLSCFLCGREIHFWSYEQHLISCSTSFIKDSTNQNKKFEKPNFNIILEILKEVSKNNNCDRSYIEFLFKEFNLESERNYQKYNDKGIMMKKPKRNRFASSSTVTPDSYKIFEKKFEHIDKENNNNIENFFKKTPLSIRCFVCGNFFTLNGFEIHYMKCKEHFDQVNLNKKVVEPDNFRSLLNNIVIGSVQRDEVEAYNLIAEKLYWDLICNICPTCKRKFIPESYDKHVKNCNGKSSIIKKQNNRNPSEISSSPDKKLEKHRMRKKSMDDIRNLDIKQIRSNIKSYFI